MNHDKYQNHLIHEKSPYLLQHAHNPVNWFPWGEEAFKKAVDEDKPIFLSIGYSTCHWCHVMEEESFVNLDVAKVLNESFVSIKVDREERPDLDHVYMTVVQALTGQGGWPMSVFLTPQLKPFYGGTYFPPVDRWGRTGFIEVLSSIREKWLHEREKVLQSSETITQSIRSEIEKKGASRSRSNEDVLGKNFENANSQFDSRYGGFGEAPKFPRPHALSSLLRYWKRRKDPVALEMVERTLQEMAKGGIYDHIGGGFHRYSVDERWHVPHFEKMLYDQALLSKTYLEAFQATHKSEYDHVAREIFNYVLRDLKDPQGAFYSAEDADSAPDPDHPHQKSEGAFYIWSHSELAELLSQEQTAIFNEYFDVLPDGNVAQDPQGEFTGKNVLIVVQSFVEIAKKFNKTPQEIKKILRESKKILFEARKNRLRPHLDDKILTDWNGLMISSFAFGAGVLKEPRFSDIAKKAADFILNKMKRHDGRLMHRFRDGDVAIAGFLDDYAFFSLGLMDLYEATFDPLYLDEAKYLTDEMVRLFWDEKNGGFMLTGHDSEKLLWQAKEIYDGAVPSGNSVAVLVLLKLAKFTQDLNFQKKAQEALEVFSSQIAQFPLGYPQMLMALDFSLGPTIELTVAGDPHDSETKNMVHEIFAQFIPNKVMAFHSTDEEHAQRTFKIIPYIENQTMIDGKPVVYICVDYACKEPVTNLVHLKEQISKLI